MITTLIKLSVCPCGFPILNKNIPLGTEYTIDLNLVSDFTLICGGCGNAFRLKGVYVQNRTQGQRSRYLPLEIFQTEF